MKLLLALALLSDIVDCYVAVRLLFQLVFFWLLLPFFLSVVIIIFSFVAVAYVSL